MQQLAHRAQCLAEQGDMSSAAELFAQALAGGGGTGPYVGDAHAGPCPTMPPKMRARLGEQLAQCLAELERDDEAVQAAAAATQADPQFAEAWWTLGRCCRNVGQLEGAEAALARAHALLTGPGDKGAGTPAANERLAAEVAADQAEVQQLASSWLAQRVGLTGLHVSQDPGGQLGPGCVVWEAGVLAAWFLAHHARELGMLPGQHVLELGSGTGLVGMAAAAAAGAHVICTDVAAVLPLLARNVEANRQLCEAGGGSAAALALHWAQAAAGSSGGGRAEQAAAAGAGTSRGESAGGEQAGSVGGAGVLGQQRWDWCVGADLVYSSAQVGLAVGALAATCAAAPGCRVLLAHKHRHAAVDEALFAALCAAGFASRRLRPWGAGPLPAGPPLPPEALSLHELWLGGDAAQPLHAL